MRGVLSYIYVCFSFGRPKKNETVYLLIVVNIEIVARPVTETLGALSRATIIIWRSSTEIIDFRNRFYVTSTTTAATRAR